MDKKEKFKSTLKDPKTVKMIFVCSEKERARMNALAQKLGVSRSEVIRYAIDVLAIDEGVKDPPECP